MERRILVSGVILTVSIIVIIGVFFIYSRSKDRANSLKIIPQDAALILRLNGFGLPEDLINEKSKVWQDIKPIQSIARLNNDIAALDSILKSIPQAFESVKNNNTYVSGHFAGGRKLYFLTILPLPDGIGTKNLNKILNTSLVLSYTQRKYEGRSIVNVNLSESRNLYFTFLNGLLLTSSSPVLIEDAIRQSTLMTSLLDDSGFARMIEVTGKNKDANIFIDLKQIGKLFSLYANNKILNKSRDYDSFGSWAELDLNLKEDIILLNGFSYPIDTSNNLLRTISGLSPVKLTIDEVLPASTSGYMAIGISSPKEYYKNYLLYLKEIGRIANYKANLKNMNSKYGIQFDQFFLNLLDDQLALAFKNNSSGADGSEYLVFKCKSGNDAKRAMERLIGAIESVTEGKLKYSYSPDKEIKHTIYRVPIYPLFGRLMGEFFNVLDENYMLIVDNYLVIAGSYKDATQFIYERMLKRTLSNNELYREFANNLSQKSFLLCYANTAKTKQFFKKYLNEETQNSWAKNLSAFKKAQTAGVQISEVSNLPYFNIFLQHQDNFRGKPQTVWESRLDTSISQKPKFVINHYTKQNEIIVQDDYNNLYLLNQTGRILWKNKLNEKINSEIYQIDYYQNGKLQFLFSTSKSIHLIDRNGNYVERYPINLRAQSTAGLALFDYESNRNYRIFIPGSDKKIYVYSKEGSLISGWKFQGTDHAVHQPVKHFRVAGKDYIVFGDKNFTYIVDRKGNRRVNISNSFSKSEANGYYLHHTGNLKDSYLVTTDHFGAVIKIYFSGKTVRQSVYKLSANHYFDFKDVNADGQSDYVFLDEEKLYVTNNNGSPIYTKTFKQKVKLRPVYYHFSYTDRKLGIVTNENKIYLINNSGDTYKGFPVEGKTQFSVGYFDLTSSRFNLIVGGRNNFLYNYAVE